MPARLLGASLWNTWVPAPSSLSTYISLPSSKNTSSKPFKGECISEVVRIGSITIFHLRKLLKATESHVLIHTVMLYFWWGCRGNLRLITLRSERVIVWCLLAYESDSFTLLRFVIATCKVPCMNGATCKNDTCICKPHYSGPLCNIGKYLPLNACGTSTIVESREGGGNYISEKGGASCSTSVGCPPVLALRFFFLCVHPICLSRAICPLQSTCASCQWNQVPVDLWSDAK